MAAGRLRRKGKVRRQDRSRFDTKGRPMRFDVQSTMGNRALQYHIVADAIFFSRKFLVHGPRSGDILLHFLRARSIIPSPSLDT